MLRTFTTPSELTKALTLTDSLPGLLSLHSSLKIRTTVGFPEAPLVVRAYPWPDVKCWLMIMRNALVEPYVGVHLVNGGTLDDAEKCIENSMEILEEFDEIYLFDIVEPLCTQLNHVLSKKFDTSGSTDFCLTFYMPLEVQARVANLDIKLPEGFRFCDLDPEVDAPLVSGTWKYGRLDDIHFTRAKLKNLPAVGVKYEDQLVAFNMVCPSGSKNHLYTLPEFRGKGIGTAVELKLCQKLIAIGIWPFKYVEIGNTKVIESSKKSGHWREVTDNETGEVVVADFRMIKKLKI